MDYPELTIAITESYDFPIVTVCGAVHASNARTIEDVIDGFHEQERNSLALDVSQASFLGIEATATLVRVLRTVNPDVRLAIVAGDNIATVLDMANFGPTIKVCANMEQAADFVVPAGEFYTSRWMGQTAGDNELPLAA